MATRLQLNAAVVHTLLLQTAEAAFLGLAQAESALLRYSAAVGVRYLWPTRPTAYQHTTHT